MEETVIESTETTQEEEIVEVEEVEVEEVEEDILSTVSESELDEAAETLVKIKQRLLELLGDDAGIAGPD